MSVSHIVVVGGGVIGVCTAYYLAKRGQKVTVVEQNEVGSGCSWGNAGQITPGHLPLPQPGTMGRNLRWLLSRTSPLYVRPRVDIELFDWFVRFSRACNRRHLYKATQILSQLGLASLRLFDELSAHLRLSYQKRGRLEVCRTERTFHAALRGAALLRRLGFESRPLMGAEVLEFEPAVQAKVAGAVYYCLSAHCNPQNFVKELARAAERLGAEFKPHTQVTDLCLQNGRLVRVMTPQGAIEADAAVLACGSWSGRLTRRLGLQLPIQPGKGYHLDINRPAVCPNVPVVLVEERIFTTPIDDFLRLAGTMELSGFNLDENPARLAMLATGVGRYLSGIDRATVRSRWCHLRPMTPDGLPIIGRAPRAGNVWIATGHGMLGLTQGPISGKLVAEWITEGRTSIDLAVLRPDRFLKTPSRIALQFGPIQKARFVQRTN